MRVESVGRSREGRRKATHVVDGNTSESSHPVGAVVEESGAVGADTLLGDRSRHVGVEEVEGGDVDLFTTNVVLHKLVSPAVLMSIYGTHLVRSNHSLVEDVESDLDEGGVGDPGTGVSGGALTSLVSADLLHGSVVAGVVVLDGDLGGHSSDGSDSSPAWFDRSAEGRRGRGGGVRTCGKS
jgi:hypothetical protein